MKALHNFLIFNEEIFIRAINTRSAIFHPSSPLFAVEEILSPLCNSNIEDEDAKKSALSVPTMIANDV